MVALIADSDAPVTVVGPDRRQQWNDFVRSHPHGHFMQLWEWGEVRGASGWQSHYLAVEGIAGFEATALVLERILPGFGMVFYTPRGPLWNPAGPDRLLTLASGVRRFAHRRGGVLWRIDPYVIDSEVLVRSQLEAVGFNWLAMPWSYWNQPKYVMLLPLEGGKDSILRAIDGNDRYKIRYASKQGVNIDRPAVSEHHIDEFYQLMKITARKKAIPVRDLPWYANLLRVFGAAGHAALFIARKGSDPVSAGVSIRMGTRAWLMYLGSDYSTSRANWALQWDMVSWAVESGCSHYDLRGTATNYPPQPDDKGYGVYQFKKSFGARLTPLLGYFDLVLAPRRYQAFRYAERRLLPLGERALEALATLRRMRAW
jgi:lipid II:glycine glycyltransferase (peptidoglycan interpeptide bridge formation enzyme)